MGLSCCSCILFQTYSLGESASSSTFRLTIQIIYCSASQPECSRVRQVRQVRRVMLLMLVRRVRRLRQVRLSLPSDAAESSMPHRLNLARSIYQVRRRHWCNGVRPLLWLVVCCRRVGAAPDQKYDEWTCLHTPSGLLALAYMPRGNMRDFEPICQHLTAAFAETWLNFSAIIWA